MREKIIVAMSGGVDSSVAAAILLEQGYDLIGITLNVWPSDECEIKAAKTCCSITDVEDARKVCNKLDIPHYVLNMRELFHERVIKRYLDDYKQGRTPNPCIECNRFVKFDALLHKAETMGINRIATGHYALIEQDIHSGVYSLKRAEDHNKDQTYVLYMLNQRHLSRLLLPVGEYSKPQIRDIAKRYGLSVSEKADSQDLCFTGAGGHSEFIKQNCASAAREGDFVSTDGRILGRHDGIHNFTIGQRKGLGISGGEPLYVTAIDAQNAIVYVGAESELYATTAEVGNLCFVHERPKRAFNAKVKVRYKATETDAKITLTGVSARVEFAQPQRAVTPGQAAVFYDGDYVIGGGTII